MNAIHIIGRLVREPESVATKSGTEMTTFSIAVDDGRDEVSYFDCKSFGKTAELVATYKHKGDQVGVSGRLKQERWEKDGEKRSAVRIIADRVTFVGSKQDREAEPMPAPMQHPDPAVAQAVVEHAVASLGAVVEDDDDIPF